MKVLICDDDKCIVDEIKNNLNTFYDKHRIVFDIDLFSANRFLQVIIGLLILLSLYILAKKNIT